MGNQQMQAAVPGDPANAEKELRRRILQNRNEVKLAIIGERNSGKSSLINTVYRVLTEDSYGFVAEKGNFNSMKQTTNFYREHKLPANITVFDSVGANYSKQEHKEWLEKIIAGWKSRSAMTSGAMSDKGNADTNNRLDFCWLVVDPLRFAQDPNWYDYYQGLSEVATVRGVRPFIVITKKAHPDINIREAETKAIFNWMPNDNIWFLENYTALQQAYRPDTEKTILMMLHNMLLRQSDGYSAHQSVTAVPMNNPMTAAAVPNTNQGQPIAMDNQLPMANSMGVMNMDPAALQQMLQMFTPQQLSQMLGINPMQLQQLFQMYQLLQMQRQMGMVMGQTPMPNMTPTPTPNFGNMGANQFMMPNMAQPQMQPQQQQPQQQQPVQVQQPQPINQMTSMMNNLGLANNTTAAPQTNNKMNPTMPNTSQNPFSPVK
jgi:energy-coupling factor transporter ATP-binding protein EcfA2